MSIQSIQANVVNGATAIYQSAESAALWTGHHIRLGCNHYIVPTIKNLWSLAASGLSRIGAFIQTTAGTAFTASIAFFFAGRALIRLSQSEEYENHSKACAALILAGLTSVALGVFSLGIGVSSLSL